MLACASSRLDPAVLGALTTSGGSPSVGRPSALQARGRSARSSIRSRSGLELRRTRSASSPKVGDRSTSAARSRRYRNVKGARVHSFIYIMPPRVYTFNKSISAVAIAFWKYRWCSHGRQARDRRGRMTSHRWPSWASCAPLMPAVDRHERVV